MAGDRTDDPAQRRRPADDPPGEVPPAASDATAARRPLHPGVAIGDLVLAALLLAAIWGALPARWWPVDVGGTLLAVLLAGSGGALLRGVPGARTLALVAGWVALGVGASVSTALALTAAHISGLYGPVGAGGAILLTVVALLILPYLVAVPAAQLVALHRNARGRPK